MERVGGETEGGGGAAKERDGGWVEVGRKRGYGEFQAVSSSGDLLRF